MTKSHEEDDPGQAETAVNAHSQPLIPGRHAETDVLAELRTLYQRNYAPRNPVMSTRWSQSSRRQEAKTQKPNNKMALTQNHHAFQW